MLKLAPHFMPGGEIDTRAWLQLKQGDKPALAVAKLAMLTPGWISDQRTKPEKEQRVLAALSPDFLTVGKPDENFQDRHEITRTNNPEALAAQYAAEIFDPLMAAAPEIRAWEGPNEIAIAPAEIDRMQCYAEFLREFARQMQRRGKRAVIGGWAVGTPDFGLWKYYIPALEACRDYGAILSRHSYGPLNEFYSYRHRLDEAEFRKLGFANTPVIISECGADGLGVPGWATWRRMFGNDAARYWSEYLLPFTQEIEKDPYVLGATLFTVGSGFQWADFDVAGMGLVPHVAAYAAQLTDAPPVVAGETTMEDYGFFTTLFGQGAHTAALGEFIPRLHNWLAAHAGDISGFVYPFPWWADKVLPFKCTFATWTGTFIHLHYHAGEPAYDLRKLTYKEIEVGKITTLADGSSWFRVFVFSDGKEMWVPAQECAPL